MIPVVESVAVVVSGVGLNPHSQGSMWSKVRCVWTLGDLKILSQGPHRKESSFLRLYQPTLSQSAFTITITTSARAAGARHYICYRKAMSIIRGQFIYEICISMHIRKQVWMK